MGLCCTEEHVVWTHKVLLVYLFREFGSTTSHLKYPKFRTELFSFQGSAVKPEVSLFFKSEMEDLEDPRGLCFFVIDFWPLLCQLTRLTLWASVSCEHGKWGGRRYQGRRYKNKCV